MAEPIGPKIFEATHVTTEKGNGCSYLQKLASKNFDMIVKFGKSTNIYYKIPGFVLLLFYIVHRISGFLVPMLEYSYD